MSNKTNTPVKKGGMAEFIETSGHLKVVSVKNGVRTTHFDNSNTIMINAKQVLAEALQIGRSTDLDGVINDGTAVADSRIGTILLGFTEVTTSNSISNMLTELPGQVAVTPVWESTAQGVRDHNVGYNATLNTDTNDNVDSVTFVFSVSENDANDAVDNSVTVFYNTFGLGTVNTAADGDASNSKLFAGNLLRGVGKTTTIQSVTNSGNNLTLLNVSDTTGFTQGDELTVSDSSPASSGYDGTYTIRHVDNIHNTILINKPFNDTAIGFAAVSDAIISIPKDISRVIEVTWTINF